MALVGERSPADLPAGFAVCNQVSAINKTRLLALTRRKNPPSRSRAHGKLKSANW